MQEGSAGTVFCQPEEQPHEVKIFKVIHTCMCLYQKDRWVVKHLNFAGKLPGFLSVRVDL